MARLMLSKINVILISLVTAVLLTLAKVIVALLTSSLSVWTEAADSVLDIVNLSLGFWAVREAAKPPDREHRYGHAKFESLVSYTEAIFVLIIIAFVANELVRRLIEPFVISVNVVSLAILFSTLSVDMAIALLNLHAFEIYSSYLLKTNYVNFMEDVVRSIAVIIALYTAEYGLYYADLIVAVLLLSVLLKEVFEIIRKSAYELVDKTPEELDSIVRTAAKGIDGLRRVARVRGRKVGDIVFMDVIIEVDPQITIRDAHKIADKLERKIKQAVPNADVIVHCEPST